MKPLVGILDHEEEYGRRLAAFIAKQPSVPFDVVLFSSMDKLREYTKQKQPDLLLLGLEQDAIENTSGVGVNRVMYLTDEKPTGAAVDDAIWRYSGAQEILSQLSLRIRPATGYVAEGERLRIFTVYSPVTRCRKTEFSIALARRMSDRMRTLFVTFEEYGFIPAPSPPTTIPDLSDVIFYVGQGALSGKLPRFLQQAEGLEFIAPVRCPQDVRTLDGEEAVTLLKTIAGEGRYDCVVVDAGQALGDVRPLLAASDRIFVPSRREAISTARVEAFRCFLVASGCTEEADRLEVIHLPDGGGYPERPGAGLPGRQEFFARVFEGEVMEYAERVFTGVVCPTESRSS
ncbi:MAG: hypothetical protein IK125_03020 [Lachnospiraceae bacterium]|nr:hypothetical protein [Lachnospiraceae bacterium]